MRMEVAVNVLDALSFALVTPEFLGEARLKIFREWLGKRIDSLLQYSDFMQDNTSRHPVAWSISTTIVPVVLLVIVTTVLKREPTFNDFLALLAGNTPVLVFVLLILLIGLLQFAHRVYLFVFGAILFFVSRTVAIVAAYQ